MYATRNVLALFREATIRRHMYHHFMYTEPKSKKTRTSKVKACRHGCRDPITGLPFKHGNAADKCKNCGRLTEKGERKKRQRAQLDALPTPASNPVLPEAPSAEPPSLSRENSLMPVLDIPEPNPLHENTDGLSDIDTELFDSISQTEREAELYVELEVLRGQNVRLKQLAKHLLDKLSDLEHEERKLMLDKIDAI